MDTDKTDGKRENQKEIDLTNKEEVEKLRREFVGEPPEKQSYDEARKHNEQVAQSIFNSLDKRINSRWVSGKDKNYLKLFRHIIEEQRRMADSMTSMSESVIQWSYGLKEILFHIFMTVELSKGLTQKDLGTVKSRMDKILENPAVKQLEKILAENAEAFKKLDATRQEILRDSVV